MLPRTASLPLALLVATSVSCLAFGCAAPPLDDVDGQGSAVTGSDETEKDSPLVYVFDSNDADATPVCMGTKVGDKHVVTVRGCGSESSVVRQASKDGATKPIAVSKVLTPTSTSSSSESSDLRVLELASKIQGPNAKIGALTLKDGYTVLGADTLDPKDKNAVEVEGRIASQTGAIGKLVLSDKDQQLCATDLGAPVFAKKPKREWYTAWLFKTGDWVLSGVVSGAAKVDPGAKPEDMAPPDPKGCANGPWSAAAVSTHADWLAKFAPAPKTSSSSSGTSANSGSTSTTKGTVQSCAIVTPTLAEVKTGARSALVEGKATVKDMQLGGARAQIGIAPKSAPSKMTWTPADVKEARSEAGIEVSMRGGIDAPTTEGDYVVLFRASADGGLTWTDCDLDGSQNGATQALGLRVSAAAPAPATPAPPADYSAPSSDRNSDDDDAPAAKDASEDDESTDKASTKKAAAASGCAVAQPASGVPANGLSLAGLALGLAAVARRRKAR